MAKFDNTFTMETQICKDFDYAEIKMVNRDIDIDGNVNILIHKTNDNIIFESNEPFLCFLTGDTYRIESGIEPIVMAGGCTCIIRSNIGLKYKDGSKNKFEFSKNIVFNKITASTHAKVSFDKNTLDNNVDLKSETHSNIYICKTNFNKVNAFASTHSKIEFNDSSIHDLTVHSKIHSSVSNFSASTCTVDADTHSTIIFSSIMTGKYACLKSCNHSAIYLKNSHYDKSNAHANTHSIIDFGRSEISVLVVDLLSFSTVSSFHATTSCSAAVNIHSKITSATISPLCRYSERIGTFSSAGIRTI